MDKAALNNIKQLILRKSLEQGIDEGVALHYAEKIAAVLSQPDGTVSYQLLSGLVVALMFKGEEKDQQIKELILSIAPQVMHHFSQEKQAELKTVLNGMKS